MLGDLRVRLGDLRPQGFERRILHVLNVGEFRGLVSERLNGPGPLLVQTLDGRLEGSRLVRMTARRIVKREDERGKERTHSERMFLIFARSESIVDLF